jgi:hypothetical protein
MDLRRGLREEERNAIVNEYILQEIDNEITSNRRRFLGAIIAEVHKPVVEVNLILLATQSG